MNSIKYSIYDLVGYFIPGSLVLWCWIELANMMNFNYSVFLINDVNIVVKIGLLVIACYAVGHLLHAIANFTIDKFVSGSYPPKDYFPNKFKNDFNSIMIPLLKDCINKKFNIPDQDNYSDENFIKDAYWVCYSYVANSKQESLTQTFLNISGFYRGLSTGFYVIAISYFVALFFSCQMIMLMVAVGSAVIAQLFYLRNKRFKYYLAKTVYSDFLSICNINKDDLK